MTAASSNPIVSIRDIEKTFDSTTQALAPVSLNIEASSFTAIVGPSGCGKSTLLRIIAGLTSQTSGDIQRQPNVNGKEAKVGFVFQDPTLMPWASVTDNVALPLKLQGTNARETNSIVNEVLDWVGLTEFKTAYPRALSGGMRMRVSIARALSTQPDLLLLDEPFAALDEFTRAQLNEDLLVLWESQKWTGIFVTHSIREAVFLADRVVVMSPRPGRVVADIQVPFPHPRHAALRDSHQFSDFCVNVSGHLARAIKDNAA